MKGSGSELRQERSKVRKGKSTSDASLKLRAKSTDGLRIGRLPLTGISAKALRPVEGCRV